MVCKNGANVLPAHLLAEVQKYINGELIYVPKKQNKKAEWGQLSGTKTVLKERNEEIYKLYLEGVSVSELADMYFLSCETIKKIVYGKKKKKAM
ncbi:CD3324 family protein [Oceanirhabdus sp. W0125-5]|uniref:CD3324 family protein n=1 Tax=Oceanirhabdus sp. W0125-5 TaxID=2999116 RepID=UPI0022F2BEBB|nr:CD3324 family protein [Oceanirhabdus sp. W0125-5]WBW95131.1 CD3324 family protein [Oceanirhabdus sp. W0125-5]